MAASLYFSSSFTVKPLMSTPVAPPPEETNPEQPVVTPDQPIVIRGGHGNDQEEEKEKKDSPFIAKFNRIFRLLKYFFLSCIILTIIEIWVAYWLISSRWHLLLSNEEMMEYADLVKAAPPMPANFMDVYTAIFPKHLHTSLKQQIFVNYGSRFLFRHTEIEDKPHCMCDMIYDIQRIKHPELAAVEWDGRLQDLEFGFGIEKYATPEQCFYYVMQYRVPEVINQLSTKHYPHLKNKTIAQMNDDELVELILLLKARTHFNRLKNPTRFKKALDYYHERIRTHRALANN
jgi:hypothetical protein